MRKELIYTIISLLITVVVMPCSMAFALGGYSTLAADDKKIAEMMKDSLQLSERDAFELFSQSVKSQLNTTDWQYEIFNNASLSATKVDKSKVRMLHMNFATDNRFVNISFQKFPIEKQILIQVTETLPRVSQVVIDKYNELKKNKEYEVGTDKDSFSVFKKTGYTGRVKTIVYSGGGGVQYVDGSSYDLKD